MKDPKSLEERRAVARQFAEDLGTKLPLLVDTIDDAVARAYGGWPDRLFIVDRNGKIALAGGPGPGGFSPAVREAPAVLRRLTSEPATPR